MIIVALKLSFPLDLLLCFVLPFSSKEHAEFG